MKIVILSDTHELHREIDVSDGDLLIHAGDVTLNSRDPWVLDDFNAWLGDLPHRWKVLVPGNHDGFFLRQKYRNAITNAHLLINEGIQLGGLNLWGSPVDFYGNTPFGISEATDRAKHWSKMPDGLHILITHIPPAGVLDRPYGAARGSGCSELYQAVLKKKPGLHIFGHEHSAYGTHSSEFTEFANAALPGPNWEMDRKPMVLTMEPD